MLAALRVQADGRMEAPFRAARAARAHRPAPSARHVAAFPERLGNRGRGERAPWHRREDLATGATIRGPALIGEYTGTTVVPPGWTARVDRFGALELDR